MRRVVKVERNAKKEITSFEVIKPKQLNQFIPVVPGNGSKEVVRKKLEGIHSDVRYSGNEKGFYVN